MTREKTSVSGKMSIDEFRDFFEKEMSKVEKSLIASVKSATRSREKRILMAEEVIDCFAVMLHRFGRTFSSEITVNVLAVGAPRAH